MSSVALPGLPYYFKTYEVGPDYLIVSKRVGVYRVKASGNN